MGTGKHLTEFFDAKNNQLSSGKPSYRIPFLYGGFFSRTDHIGWDCIFAVESGTGFCYDKTKKIGGAAICIGLAVWLKKHAAKKIHLQGMTNGVNRWPLEKLV